MDRKWEFFVLPLDGDTPSQVFGPFPTEEDATAFVASRPSSRAQIGYYDEYLVLMGSVIRRSDAAQPPLTSPRRNRVAPDGL